MSAIRSVPAVFTRFPIVLPALAATSLMIAQLGGSANAGEIMPIEEELIASGPIGPLMGTLTLPNERPLSTEVPVFLIVPGSGPTDRNGNSPLGISAAPYRLLAEGLAERGYPSVRIDKRGLFGSERAIPDPNNVTIADYGDDILAWTNAIRELLPTEDGARCVIPLGHSEGGLVALAAMARFPDACGLILIASLGRPLDVVIREQLRANSANAPLLEEADAALTMLSRGERVDAGTMDAALLPLFGADVQDYLIDAFSYEPTQLAAQIAVPMLVIQGTRDLQVSTEDARMLAHSAPNATLALVPDVNHVLKIVATEDPSANLATYADPNLPIAPSVVDAVTQFGAGIRKE